MSFPPVNRLTTAKLATWFREQVSSGASVVPGRVPSVPNRIVGIEMQAGPGIRFDSLFDVVGVRITCRGAENNQSDAEAIALDVDDVILNCEDNFEIGEVGDSVWVNGMGRTGGGPTQSSIPDSDSRWTYTCSYFISVSTNVGKVN